MNYKNRITGAIISSECYWKLPVRKQVDYYRVDDSITHKYDEDGDDLLTGIVIGAVVGGIIGDIFDSSDSSSSSSNSSSDSNFDFGGGDFGGGGAGSDW